MDVWRFDVHPPGDGEGQSEEFGNAGVGTAWLAGLMATVAIASICVKLES